MIELATLAENPISPESENYLWTTSLWAWCTGLLFPTYSWAPRGYGSAPTSNAMLHAGVLKKFGIYGLIRRRAASARGSIIMVSYPNMASIRQRCSNRICSFGSARPKQMIGFGSVMHMGYCFLGLATLSVIGIGGAVLLMVAHGMSVALLFLLANYVQKRTGTLEMPDMGGLASKSPVLAAFFVAATMASIGYGFAIFWVSSRSSMLSGPNQAGLLPSLH